MADNLMSGLGDPRRSYDDSGGYGKYGLGRIPRARGEEYKCNKKCPYLTNKPSCKCPSNVLDRFTGFHIKKGKFGDGCSIYLAIIKGTHIPKGSKSLATAK